MVPKVLNEKIMEINELATDIFQIKIMSPYLAENSLCGQFVNIKCSDSNDLSLRRPISICNVDRKQCIVDLVFQVKGHGTMLLSQKKVGDSIDVMGPLGNSFTVKKLSKIAVVGGGIGIFPLLYLLNSLEGFCNKRVAILGFRNKDAMVLKDEFDKNSEELFITTDDGSYGYKGFNTDLLEQEISKGLDMIYACGPLPMIKKVSAIAKKNGIPCEISMEERMGCGIGACLVCSCKTKDSSSPNGEKYSHVCKDGPIFNSQEVIFDD